MLNNKQKQEKKSIGFYPDVLRFIDEEAKRQHRSRSNMLDIILRKYFNLESREETTPSRPIAK
jgi:hypothetical protein